MNKLQQTRIVSMDTWSECITKIPFYASLLFLMVVAGMQTYTKFFVLCPIVGKITIIEVIVNIISSPLHYFLVLGGLFIYLMRAPYFCRADALLLPRLGRGPWIWGKVLFVAEYSLLAILLIYAFATILCFPYIDFTRCTWTTSYVETNQLGMSMTRMPPLQILLQTFCLNYTFIFLMALIAMLFNLCYSRVASVVVVGGVCAISTVIENTYIFANLKRWGLTLQASMYYHRFEGIDNIMGDASKALPTVPESLLLFAAGCILCLILIRYRVRNYDFQLESKGMH